MLCILPNMSRKELSQEEPPKQFLKQPKSQDPSNMGKEMFGATCLRPLAAHKVDTDKGINLN